MLMVSKKGATDVGKKFKKKHEVAPYLRHAEMNAATHISTTQDEPISSHPFDPVHTAYINKMERKVAKSTLLLKQEHRRIEVREEEQDWNNMTDAWADKILSASKVCCPA